MWCRGRASGRSSFTAYRRTVGQVGPEVEEKVRRPSKASSACNPRSLAIPACSASAASALMDTFKRTAAAAVAVARGLVEKWAHRHRPASVERAVTGFTRSSSVRMERPRETITR